MDSRREALRLELRSIIGTDRQAAEIIENANAQRRDIEENTRRQRQRILEDAAQRQELLTKQVKAELETEAEHSRQQAGKSFAEAKSRIGLAVQQNRDAWVDGMVARILGRGE